MADPTPQYDTVTTFDRLLGTLDGVPGVDKTKATTIIALVDVIGKASTFIVQTYRRRDDDGVRTGDTVFIQHIDALGSARFVLPPEVADTIARQRDALGTKGRRRGAAAAAETRKARGVVAGFAAMTPAQRKAARARAKVTRQHNAARKAARKAAKGVR